MLVRQRLLPGVIGLTGPDGVHVSTEIFTILASVKTRAIYTQAKVVQRDLFRRGRQAGTEVSAAKADLPFLAFRVRVVPEPLPFGECRGAKQTTPGRVHPPECTIVPSDINIVPVLPGQDAS